jgi:hypothetical protein
MRLLSERAINAEVLRRLDKLSPRYLDLVGHRLPSFLRAFGRLFVGVPNSLMYRELERGRLSYRMYCFARLSGVPSRGRTFNDARIAERKHAATV